MSKRFWTVDVAVCVALAGAPHEIAGQSANLATLDMRAPPGSPIGSTTERAP
jgi:hypothetical protein